MTKTRNPYLVIKRQRSVIDGKWFSYRGVGYADEATAIEAARAFAESHEFGGEGTQIIVRKRSNNAEIVTFRWDGFGPKNLRMFDWRDDT